MLVTQLKLSPAERETLLRLFAGIDTATAQTLGLLASNIEPFNDLENVNALRAVIADMVSTPPKKPDMAVVKTLMGTKSLPHDAIDIASMSAEEFKAVFSAAQQKDILSPLLKDNGEFGEILTKVLDSTFRNAFTNILMESAEVAVREASLDILRATFISVAKGSKKTTIEGEIKKRFGKGGGQDGDPEPERHNP